MVLTLERRETFSEVLEVLRHMDKTYVDMLPKKLIMFLYDNCSLEYDFRMTKSIGEENLKEDSKIDELKEVREVFPKSIPTDAKNIEFSYMPQFLQGGEVFELSYTATDDKLTEWSTLLEGNSEWVGSNQQWHNENDWSSDCVDATRYQLYWDGGFNHGEICYALISEELNQITFYYSIW